MSQRRASDLLSREGNPKVENPLLHPPDEQHGQRGQRTTMTLCWREEGLYATRAATTIRGLPRISPLRHCLPH